MLKLDNIVNPKEYEKFVNLFNAKDTTGTVLAFAHKRPIGDIVGASNKQVTKIVFKYTDAKRLLVYLAATKYSGNSVGATIPITVEPDATKSTYEKHFYHNTHLLNGVNTLTITPSEPLRNDSYFYEGYVYSAYYGRNTRLDLNECVIEYHINDGTVVEYPLYSVETKFCSYNIVTKLGSNNALMIFESNKKGLRIMRESIPIFSSNKDFEPIVIDNWGRVTVKMFVYGRNYRDVLLTSKDNNSLLLTYEDRGTHIIFFYDNYEQEPAVIYANGIPRTIVMYPPFNSSIGRASHQGYIYTEDYPIENSVGYVTDNGQVRWLSRLTHSPSKEMSGDSTDIIKTIRGGQYVKFNIKNNFPLLYRNS